MRCLYGTDCPLKLNCVFTHTKEEIGLFKENEHLGDYIVAYSQDQQCEEDLCAEAGKCICNDMDHPKFVAYYTNAKPSRDDDSPQCLLSAYHCLGPCLCPKCVTAWDTAPTPSATPPSSDINDPSYYSSGDEQDPYMDPETWASGWWDLYPGYLGWADDNGYFTTDDGLHHRVPQLQHVGDGYLMAFDSGGECYYIHPDYNESSYLDPRGYNCEDDGRAIKERYHGCPAPRVIYPPTSRLY